MSSNSSDVPSNNSNLTGLAYAKQTIIDVGGMSVSFDALVNNPAALQLITEGEDTPDTWERVRLALREGSVVKSDTAALSDEPIGHEPAPTERPSRGKNPQIGDGYTGSAANLTITQDTEAGISQTATDPKPQALVASSGMTHLAEQTTEAVSIATSPPHNGESSPNPLSPRARKRQRQKAARRAKATEMDLQEAAAQASDPDLWASFKFFLSKPGDYAQRFAEMSTADRVLRREAVMTELATEMRSSAQFSAAIEHSTNRMRAALSSGDSGRISAFELWKTAPKMFRDLNIVVKDTAGSNAVGISEAVLARKLTWEGIRVSFSSDHLPKNIVQDFDLVMVTDKVQEVSEALSRLPPVWRSIADQMRSKFSTTAV